MYVPAENGEKNLDRFFEMNIGPHKRLDYLRDLPTIFRKMPIVMYDQEVLSEQATFSLRYRMQITSDPAEKTDIDQLPLSVIVSIWTRTLSTPIWCHSELESDYIKDLQRVGFQTCYYWYHAIISREWYRDYQYDRQLLPRNDCGNRYRFLLYCRDMTGSRAYRQRMRKELEQIAPQVLHDWHYAREISPDHSAVISVDDAVNSCVHIVAETIFADNKLYLTEKVFKPMVMSQPFVIFGPPGSLALLRQYGFHTFDHVWDESYDLETDHDTRLRKCTDLILSIARMPQAQFAQMYASCLPAIDHNRRRFYSTEFLDFCWQELHLNITHAKDVRDQTDLPGGQIFSLIGHNSGLLQISRFNSLIKNIWLTVDANQREKILSLYPSLRDL